jgi:hypothetical protein
MFLAMSNHKSAIMFLPECHDLNRNALNHTLILSKQNDKGIQAIWLRL